MSFSKLGALLPSASSSAAPTGNKSGRDPEKSARPRWGARRARYSKLLPLLLGGVFGLGALSGCGEEGDSGRGGSLTIPYLLGNSLKCTDLNITNVRVTLQNASVAAPVISTLPCDNSNKVTLPSVPVGQWSVTIEGIDTMGVVTMDNRNQSPPPVAEVLGTDIASTSATISLSAVPAHIFARWNTQYDSCSGLGIDSFRISAWDASGATQLGMGTVGCNAPINTQDSFRRLPDPNRSIQGAAVHSLSVLPLNPQGSAVGSPVRFELMRPPGAGYSVFLSLICDKTQGCRKDGEAVVNAVPSQSTNPGTGTSTSTQ